MSVAVTTEVRRVRMRRQRRAVVVTVALALVTAMLFVLTLSVGSYVVDPLEVARSVLRVGFSHPAVDFVVHDLRLPVALSALCVGAALGAAGTVFQQVLRNRLASPDIIGVSHGASLLAVTGIVVLGTGAVATSGLALIGGIGGAAAMYLLAWRDGISGYRFILMGIGVAAMFQGLTGYVITRADLYDARTAMHWLTGTVGRVDGVPQTLLAAGLLALLPALVIAERRLRELELGDDVTRNLGGRPEAARAALIGIAVALVSLATAVAGPITFVALVAGPVANRLLGPASGAVLPAAATGAGLVLGADLIANHLLPAPLPTGVVTGALGAVYLGWLLATVNREGKGG